MPNEAYAESVVRQLLGGAKRDMIWEGSKSWLVWFASSFLPVRVLVSGGCSFLAFFCLPRVVVLFRAPWDFLKGPWLLYDTD